MKAWVIKNEQGKYFAVSTHNYCYERYWANDLLYCHHFMRFEDADNFLKDQINIERDSVCKHFENCKVATIEIREVDNEVNND